MLNRSAGATPEAPGRACEAQGAARYYNGARVESVTEKKPLATRRPKNAPDKIYGFFILSLSRKKLLLQTMPLVRKIYIGDHGVLGVWKIEETVEELIAQIHFTASDRETFERFRNKSRQAHWLSYRLAIRHILGDPKELEFYYDEYGKLHFKDHQFSLSVSHSGDYATVILSHSHCVGIDVEKISDRINNISLKFLSVKELTEVDENNHKQLTCMWSAKEALFKLYGAGELIFDKNITLEACDTSQETGNFRGWIMKDDWKEEFLLKYFFLDDYVVVYTLSQVKFPGVKAEIVKQNI